MRTLRALSDLETIFGPDAKAQDNKKGDRAEAGRPESQAMQNIHQAQSPRQQGLTFEGHVVRAADPKASAENLFRALQERFQQQGPFSEAIEITPAFAALLLERNPNNRKLKTLQVETIARDIAEGRWETNSETIIVSRDGLLNDGQNRLSACVLANLPIVSFLAFGLTRETRQTIDSNQTTRTPGDFLHMAGIEDANNIAAVAAYLWQIDRFGEIPNHHNHSSNRPTKQQIQEYVERKHATLALASKATSSSHAGRLYSRSLVAAALHHIRDAFGVHAEGDAPEAFIRKLLTGADLVGSDDPVLVVRNRLMDDKRRKRSDSRVAFELIVRAWNHHCRRQTIAKCLSTGELPKVETILRSR